VSTPYRHSAQLDGHNRNSEDFAVKRKLLWVPAALLIGAGIAALGAAAASGIPVTEPTSHTAVWENSGLGVICGVENPVISKTKVLCQGSGVPRPPHSSPNEGDPAVTLAATGKPQLVLISQDSYPPTATPRTLGAGRTWSSRGVTCRVSAHAVTCKNADNHGFTLRNKHYKAL
jgi:hypothetical protein